MRQAYLENGWDGFGSITEEAQGLTALRNHEFKDFTLYPHLARDKVYMDPRPRQELKQLNIYTMIGAYLHSENGPGINTSRLSEGTSWQPVPYPVRKSKAESGLCLPTR